ncbi:hypothetical protein C7999DRAFT_29725 [Corynascus novoguineensis]|uniref:Uncharacterized protein n=1 Tax=Corynascus novoguineensis TaxID=1126955 RepID=A0AAN7HHA1_9PEZI|nr:hypothetical protein C7999DRAFT_29725 [Corynascus novoguineensis]
MLMGTAAVARSEAHVLSSIDLNEGAAYGCGFGHDGGAVWGFAYASAYRPHSTQGPPMSPFPGWLPLLTPFSLTGRAAGARSAVEVHVLGDNVLPQGRLALVRGSGYALFAPPEILDKIADWECVGVSNLLRAFSTGITDDDIDHARVVVLKANNSLYGTCGILFTVEEMDEKEKVAWKATWMDMVLFKSAGESDLDLAMTNKNHALYRHMSGWASRPLNEKGSVDSD